MLRRGLFGRAILAAVALLLSTSALSAGHGVWTSQGPEGGITPDLVVTPGQPSVLYSALFRGVYKSVDQGRTWRKISQAITAQILCLAADPSDPQTLYAGTTSNGDASPPVEGVYKTSNGGRTWKRLGLHEAVTALSISPVQPATVWAGTIHGLYMSRDAGASWALVDAVPQKSLLAVEAHPTRGGTVYASGEEGLFKTEDGGATWRRISDGLISFGPGALAIDPNRPERIYIAGQLYGGVLRSDDGGSTWLQPATVLSPYQVRALAVDPVSSVLYAAPWSAPAHVYKSLDGGRTWKPAGRGLRGGLVYSLAIDPNDRSTLYASTMAGVWKSSDRGASWAPVNRGIRQTSVRDVVVDPSTPGTAFATADYAGVFKSTDRGASWELLGGGLDAGLVEAVAVEPSTPSSPAIVYAGTEGGIFRSLDGGGSWSRLATGPAGPVHDLALSPPDTLYAATEEGAFRSTDHGETWSSLWPNAGEHGPIRRIFVSPARPSDLYLAATSGIYFSLDGGATWTKGDHNFTPFVVVVDPLRPSIVYASTGAGFFKSFDSGLTWSPIGSGLPAATITDLEIDPSRPDTLYASSWLGVHRSLDGGVSWAPFRNPNGTGPTQVQSLALDPRGALTLYAGTNEQGVFDRTLGNPLPPGNFLVTEALPGYRFKVLVTAPGQPPRAGRLESDCPPKTLCVSATAAGQTDVRVRVSALRPNGYYWLTIERFTPSQVEIWAERPGTGDRKYYRLPAVPPGSDLPGRVDRTAFPVR